MSSLFDRLPDGRAVHSLTLRGPHLTARLLDLGATIQDLRLVGVDHPLVLGFERAADYLGDQGLYVGAIVGRFANRIGGARFSLDGVMHQVQPNQLGGHQLHGGEDGIHGHIWQMQQLDEATAVLHLTLPDGHMGYPGTLQIRAEISVAGDALSFDLSAISDKPTLCNLAHHGYFNLDGSADIRGHQIQILADHYLPVDADLIPTGAIKDVGGTRFDLREPTTLHDPDYDHNLCLSATAQPCRLVANLRGSTGRLMQIETTEPGLQLYDGRHFDGVAGLVGRHYGRHAGLALETQIWPDAPNQPDFPNAILRPGAEYRAQTRYRFA